MFESSQAELLGTLFYLTGNLEDARDALRETFIKCWRNQQQLVDVQNVKAWVFCVALNTGRDVRQVAGRRRRVSTAAENLVRPHQEPTHQARREAPETQLREVIHNLSPEEQEVFLLRQNGDMTYEEIASALAVPSATVKARMRLAVARLRSAVSSNIQNS